MKLHSVTGIKSRLRTFDKFRMFAKVFIDMQFHESKIC